MVRAILEGRKTQTRRIVKPQPPPMMHIDTCHYNNTGFAFWHNGEGANTGTCTCKDLKPPYGVPGDRLWVRETFYADVTQAEFEDVLHDGTGIYYRATEIHPHLFRWRPSIHMPRWASRITLEVVSVRVERLNDISEEDAIAEGCPYGVGGWMVDPAVGDKQFPTLWESINGPGSWDANPWVWVREFKRIEP